MTSRDARFFPVLGDRWSAPYRGPLGGEVVVEVVRIEAGHLVVRIDGQRSETPMGRREFARASSGWLILERGEER